MNIKIVIYTIISLIISFLLVTFDFTNLSKEPKQVYRVYLKGKSLGLISSKKDLEEYIDKKQQSIKEKYKVDNVYVPDELDIVKEVTFANNILTTKKIYQKIQNMESFTIDGYEVTIKGITKQNNEGKKIKQPTKNIYMLDDKVFKEAVKKTVQAFITKEKYEVYKNDEQEEIKDTGTIIENLYIKNKISIKKKRIPVDQKIYLSSEELTKFLLFGTTKDQEKYIVKSGDTIEEIAFNNKMSTEEILVANTNFKDKNSLLYAGQAITIGILQPQFDLVEEDHSVSDVEVNYETETKYDNSKYVGYTMVEQSGIKGKNRVTQKIQKVNGETMTIVTVKTEELSKAVKEIVVKGGKQSSYESYYGSGYGAAVATKGEWGWPATCSTISSPFGYRWGVLHDGTDIAGCGYGSNIFAAQAGTVETVSYNEINGKYIIINHHNGYYSYYGHLSSQSVKVGQTVSKGQVIGTMGKTGFATGVHVHFAIWSGFPYRGKVLNAMNFY